MAVLTVKVFVQSGSDGNAIQDTCEALQRVAGIFERSPEYEPPLGGELRSAFNGRRLGSYVVEFGVSNET